jgi:hypothetical protein
MMPVENRSLDSSSPPARIDLFSVILGETGEAKKFEVTAVYIHALASLLPVKVVRAILKDECEPQEIRPLLARCSALVTDKLNLLFLQATREASLKPLRSEIYGTPTQSVTWHFFATTDTDGVAGIIRKLRLDPN